MTPVEITFRSMEPSPAVEDTVRTWVQRLAHSFKHILRCAVVIEQPHQHSHQGKTFQVHVYVTIPERTIAVTRDPGIDHAHEDVYVAISDAFRAARRILQDESQIRRGEVKLHA